MKKFKKILAITSASAFLVGTASQIFAVSPSDVVTTKYGNTYISVIRNSDCTGLERIEDIIEQILQKLPCEDNSGNSNGNQNNDNSNQDSSDQDNNQGNDNNNQGSSDQDNNQGNDNNNQDSSDQDNNQGNDNNNQDSSDQDNNQGNSNNGNQDSNGGQTNKPDSGKPDDNGGNSQDQESNSGVNQELKNLANEVVRLVNAQRAANGLKALEIDVNVQSAAQVRAKEINTVFSHTRPNGTSCFTALKENNVSYRGAGENIASGQTSAQQVMNSWMNSEGHRANILNSKFTKIGVGVYKTSSGRYCWTQMFTY